MAEEKKKKSLEEVMKFETALPTDFDGVFRFTNWTDETFIGKWGGKEYHFAPMSTSKMVMTDYSPLEVQNIRKKFAKDLAEQAFFNSAKYKEYLSRERNPDGTPRFGSLHGGTAYTVDELSHFIQKCLEPLPVAQTVVTEAPKPKIEDVLSRNEAGELNTEAIDQKKSLRKKALEA